MPFLTVTTYVDANGKAVGADDPSAHHLLGIKGDEVTDEVAESTDGIQTSDTPPGAEEEDDAEEAEPATPPPAPVEESGGRRRR